MSAVVLALLFFLGGGVHGRRERAHGDAGGAHPADGRIGMGDVHHHAALRPDADGDAVAVAGREPAGVSGGDECLTDSFACWTEFVDRFPATAQWRLLAAMGVVAGLSALALLGAVWVAGSRLRRGWQEEQQEPEWVSRLERRFCRWCGCRFCTAGCGGSWSAIPWAGWRRGRGRDGR